MKHSPGPWRWDGDTLVDAAGGVVVMRGDQGWAEDDGYEPDRVRAVEDDADAALIAAAPEMLALLRWAYGELLAYDHDPKAKLMEIEALLARIGEEP